MAKKTDEGKKKSKKLTVTDLEGLKGGAMTIEADTESTRSDTKETTKSLGNKSGRSASAM